MSILIQTNPFLRLVKDLAELVRGFRQPTSVTTKELQEEIKKLKAEVTELRNQNWSIEYRLLELEGKEKLREQNHKNQASTSNSEDSLINTNYLNLITIHKWYCEIKLIIKNEEINLIALIDSGADINCLQEGIINLAYSQNFRRQKVVET